MCLLTFYPAGVHPDTDALANGAALNTDGHGYAIATTEQLIVRHGMDAGRLIDTFAADRARHLAGPALFHSRWTTHGATGLDNCHPFRLGGDPRTVIAHNGVLPATVQPRKHDPRSDTRIAAEDFLPAFGPLRIRRIRRQVERWMTPHNKMVILTIDRRYRHQAYILNETAGIWDNGIWYSNDGYRPPRRAWRAPAWWYLPATPAVIDLGPETGDTAPCVGCRAIIDLADTTCDFCGWCFDCDAPASGCQCYPPAYLSRSDASRTEQGLTR